MLQLDRSEVSTIVPPTLRFDRVQDSPPPMDVKSDISPMDMDGSDMSSKPWQKSLQRKKLLGWRCVHGYKSDGDVAILNQHCY